MFGGPFGPSAKKDNKYSQLGHGNTTDKHSQNNTPFKKHSTNISWMSWIHFFAKNSQNQIFATGKNNYGQLRTEDIQSLSIPKKMNSQYFTIWGSNQHTTNSWNRTASESTMNWNEEEMKKLEMIQSRIKQVKLNLASNNNNKIKQEFPQNSFES